MIFDKYVSVWKFYVAILADVYILHIFAILREIGGFFDLV